MLAKKQLQILRLPTPAIKSNRRGPRFRCATLRMTDLWWFNLLGRINRSDWQHEPDRSLFLVPRLSRNETARNELGSLRSNAERGP